jgi:hypothetical protein
MMAYFAALDDDLTVTAVVAVDGSLLIDDNGYESEMLGIEYLCHHVGNERWVQTSYTARIRRRYAGIGMTYSVEHDAFIMPKPYPSWLLDLNDANDWIAPIPKPTDEGYWYEWDEQGQQWIPHEIERSTP